MHEICIFIHASFTFVPKGSVSLTLPEPEMVQFTDAKMRHLVSMD